MSLQSPLEETQMRLTQVGVQWNNSKSIGSFDCIPGIMRSGELDRSFWEPFLMFPETRKMVIVPDLFVDI